MKAKLIIGAALLAISSSASAAPVPAKGDPVEGQSIFEDRCTMCHAPGGGGQGPSLKGVVGRKAASLPGFHYSAALAASGLAWTPANLDHFLAGPAAMVPGTAMQVMIPNPDQRRDLVAYLATLGR